MSALTGALPPVVAVLLADTSKFSASLGKAGAEMKGFSVDSSSKLQSLASIGKAALLGIGVAAIGIGGESIKMASDFQASMTRLVTGAGESEGAISKLSQGVLSLAPQVGYGPKQLADALYLIESASYHGADALDVLKAAAQGARADGADLTVTGNALTTVMQDIHASTGAAATVMSQMVAAVGSGKMTMQDFASSIHSVLPNASALGINFAQVAGAIATMTSQGISADQATQNLNHTIVALAAPTLVMQKAMAQYGIDSRQLKSDLGKQGLTGTFDELTQAIASHMGPAGLTIVSAFNQSKAAARDAQTMFDALPASLKPLAQSFIDGTISTKAFSKEVKRLPADQGNLIGQFAVSENRARGFSQQLRSSAESSDTFTGAMKAMTGGQVGLQVALHLTGQNAATFARNVQAVSAATAQANGDVRDSTLVHKTFAFQLAQTEAAVQVLGVKIGTLLIPVVQRVATAVAGAVTWLMKHQAVAIALGVAIGSVLVVAIIAYTIAMAQAAIATLAATWPILAIIAAVAALGVGIYELATHWSTVWDFIKDVASEAWHWLYSNVFQPIEDAFGKIGSAIGGAFKPISTVGSLLGIPGLAEGGVVTKPTLAVIGEAGYPEAVVPLKNGVSADPAHIAPLLGAAGVAAVPSSSASWGTAGPSGDLVLSVNGTEFARGALNDIYGALLQKQRQVGNLQLTTRF